MGNREKNNKGVSVVNFGIKLPFDKGIIYADIKSAKMIIYDTARMYNKNPYMLCLGAYHAGQAVEKTLKYVLALVNPVEAREKNNTHNIAELILAIEKGSVGFMDSQPDLVRNAANISKLNGLRYGTCVINRKQAIALYHLANNLVNDIVRNIETGIAFNPREETFYVEEGDINVTRTQASSYMSNRRNNNNTYSLSQNNAPEKTEKKPVLTDKYATGEKQPRTRTYNNDKPPVLHDRNAVETTQPPVLTDRNKPVENNDNTNVEQTQERSYIRKGNPNYRKQPYPAQNINRTVLNKNKAKHIGDD